MKHLLLWLPLLALLAGCGGGDSIPPEDVVARVNGDYLTRAEMTALLPAGEWDSVSPARRQAIVNDWKRLTLLSQLAIEEGLDTDPVVLSDLRNGDRKILANTLLREKLRQTAPAPDAFEKQMHEYYQTQYDKTRYDFSVQQLTVYSQELADKVWEELQAGVSYYDVYQRHGNEDILYTRGSVTRNQLSDALYLALADARQYQSVQVESDGCWEFARYLSRHEVELGFDNPEVQAQIREILTEQRERELVERLIREREAASEIVIEL